MEKLALFDVDYTITKKETLLQFFKYSLKENKCNVKYIPNSLYCGAMYMIGIYDEKKVKESFLKFLYNRKKDYIDSMVKKFYFENLKNILYKDGVDMIRKLKREGYKVFLISASPEFYLNEFYNIKEVDKVIGSRFQYEDDKFTCKMEGLNCKGEEKVKRLMEVINREKLDVDFKNSYMFSDSMSDKPLLDLVGRPYLINYRKKTKYKILNWN